jgi:hypothetical protein
VESRSRRPAFEAVEPNALDTVTVFMNEDDVIESRLSDATAAWHFDSAPGAAIGIHDDVVRW